MVVVRALFIFGTVLASWLVQGEQGIRSLFVGALVLSWAGMLDLEEQRMDA